MKKNGVYYMEEKGTYPRTQYNLAYSLLREAFNSRPGSRKRIEINEVLDRTVEESYINKARQSLRNRHEKIIAGVDFWEKAKHRLRRRDGFIATVILINDHVKNYFLPF